MVALNSSTLSFDPAELHAIPAEAAMVMTALEAGTHRRIDRRDRPRCAFRMTAHLRLFSDAHAAVPWRLYMRHASRRAMGFATPHRLPQGYGGVIELHGPDGQPLQLHSTLLRCRQAAPAWFEGCVYFNREQHLFE